MNSARFLREFMSSPALTGAIAPSSSFLAKAVIDQLNLRDAQAVLEYGPGTGTLTKHIVRNLAAATKFVAIEINPRLALLLKSQHPRVTLAQDSVANVRTICDDMGIHSVDCIVSGLPWATFSEALQVELLEATMSVLKPGGRFVTFAYIHGAYLPTGKRFAAMLPKYFSRVRKSDVVWLNVPPAFLYCCVR